MTDWAAKWFEIRAEMGQSDIATMMYQDADRPIKKMHFHHREADGFGKIQSLLFEEGIEVSAPTRPLKKPNAFFQLFLLLKGLALHPRLPHNPWKDFEPSARSASPDEVSFLFLSPQENEKLKLKARQKKLNVGFFILSELDSIVKNQLFKNPQDWGTWLSPVDLRGAFPDAHPGRNFVSFVPTRIKGSNDENEILKAFEEYKKNLKSGIYWAFWELSQIGKWIGVKGMRFLAKKGTAGSFWMGSFSDLGVWNQPELWNSKAKFRHWVIAPPGSPAYPIGATTIEWCGNRSIALKIHPAVCRGKSLETSNLILNMFREKLGLIKPAEKGLES